jgi:hypothetical protein
MFCWATVWSRLVRRDWFVAIGSSQDVASPCRLGEAPSSRETAPEPHARNPSHDSGEPMTQAPIVSETIAEGPIAADVGAK